jgi:hypothetical protein
MSAHFDEKLLSQGSTVYHEFQVELEEINRHKWIESEKAGHDIGFEQALMDWVMHHRAGWLKYRHHLRSLRAGGSMVVA